MVARPGSGVVLVAAGNLNFLRFANANLMSWSALQASTQLCTFSFLFLLLLLIF
jgi:hypothetical protein